MATDFASLRTEANEWLHPSDDPGHGWRLDHPIGKCLLFQRHLYDQRRLTARAMAAGAAGAARGSGDSASGPTAATAALGHGKLEEEADSKVAPVARANPKLTAGAATATATAKASVKAKASMTQVMLTRAESKPTKVIAKASVTSATKAWAKSALADAKAAAATATAATAKATAAKAKATAAKEKATQVKPIKSMTIKAQSGELSVGTALAVPAKVFGQRGTAAC